MVKKRLNILKVVCLITSILAIITIANSDNVAINQGCLFGLVINYLYIMTPIKRVKKRKR